MVERVSGAVFSRQPFFLAVAPARGFLESPVRHTLFDTLPDGIRQILGSAWRLARLCHQIGVEATSPQALPSRGVRPFPSAQRYRYSVPCHQVERPFFDESSGIFIP